MPGSSSTPIRDSPSVLTSVVGSMRALSFGDSMAMASDVKGVRTVEVRSHLHQYLPLMSAGYCRGYPKAEFAIGGHPTHLVSVASAFMPVIRPVRPRLRHQIDALRAIAVLCGRAQNVRRVQCVCACLGWGWGSRRVALHRKTFFQCRVCTLCVCVSVFFSPRHPLRLGPDP